MKSHKTAIFIITRMEAVELLSINKAAAEIVEYRIII